MPDKIDEAFEHEEEAIELLNELDAHLGIMFPNLDKSSCRDIANEALSYIDARLNHQLLLLILGLIPLESGK